MGSPIHIYFIPTFHLSKTSSQQTQIYRYRFPSKEQSKMQSIHQFWMNRWKLKTITHSNDNWNLLHIHLVASKYTIQLNDTTSIPIKNYYTHPIWLLQWQNHVNDICILIQSYSNAAHTQFLNAYADRYSHGHGHGHHSRWMGQ